MDEVIKFGVHLEDAYSYLDIESNSGIDKRGILSKDALSHNDCLVISIGDDEYDERFIGITLEGAEEIVRELTRAIAFLKE